MQKTSPYRIRRGPVYIGLCGLCLGCCGNRRRSRRPLAVHICKYAIAVCRAVCKTCVGVARRSYICYSAPCRIVKALYAVLSCARKCRPCYRNFLIACRCLYVLRYGRSSGLSGNYRRSRRPLAVCICKYTIAVRRAVCKTCVGVARRSYICYSAPRRIVKALNAVLGCARKCRPSYRNSPAVAFTFCGTVGAVGLAETAAEALLHFPSTSARTR